MPITSEETTQINVNFSQWRMKRLIVIAPTAAAVSAQVWLIKFDPNSGLDQQGTERHFSITDLLALAATDPTIAAVVNDVVAAVGALAKAQGIIV